MYLFISGVQRTCTSILAHTLDTHRDISMTCEQNYFDVWTNLERRWLKNGTGDGVCMGVRRQHYENVIEMINSGMMHSFTEFHNIRKPFTKYCGDKWMRAIHNIDWLDSKMDYKMILTRKDRDDTLASLRHFKPLQDKTMKELEYMYDSKMEIMRELDKRKSVITVDAREFQKNPSDILGSIAHFLDIENDFDSSRVRVFEKRTLNN